MVMKPHSNRKVWWTCDQCPDGHAHDWEATVDSRTPSNACPFCASRAVCQHNSLATKSPAIAAQFSAKNQGTASDYMVSSNKNVMWQCQHGREWDASVSSRASGKNGCPVCFKLRSIAQPKAKHPILTKSQHPMMQHWDVDAEAGLDPGKPRCRSGVKANWVCHACPRGRPHKWQAAVDQMYAGLGCPCCSGQKACICNSFESLYPEVAAEWDYSRNIGTPSDYTAPSHKAF